MQANIHAPRTEIGEVRLTVYVIPSENKYTCRVLLQDIKYGNFITMCDVVCQLYSQNVVPFMYILGSYI
jgi:hypothetical protein